MSTEGWSEECADNDLHEMQLQPQPDARPDDPLTLPMLRRLAGRPVAGRCWF